MEKSFKFKHISTHLLKLVSLITSNQNILKCITYLDNNPLSNPDVTEDLIGKNIILTLFDESILDENKISIFINPIRFNLSRQPVGEITYAIDIIIPNQYWLLHGQGILRGYLIGDEIVQLLDQQHGIGVGEANVYGGNAFTVGTNYMGLSLEVRITTSTLKGLR